MLRRHDYVLEVLGVTTPLAHYMSGHRTYDGIVAPTLHRIYPMSKEGGVELDQLGVAIDLAELRFE